MIQILVILVKMKKKQCDECKLLWNKLRWFQGKYICFKCYCKLNQEYESSLIKLFYYNKNNKKNQI
jgi:hypothetical protein